MAKSCKLYDVIVAGAGIAGSLFSAKLAGRGYKVLMIDKSSGQEDIQNRLDLVECQLLEIAGVELPSELDEVPPLSNAELGPSKSTYKFELNDCAYRMIERNPFLRYLRKLASENGAELIYGCKGVKPTVESGFVTGLATTEGIFKSRITVDATGAERALLKTMPLGMGLPRRIPSSDFVTLYSQAWLSQSEDQDYGNSRGKVRYYLYGGGSFSRSIVEENGKKIFEVEIGFRGLESHKKPPDMILDKTDYPSLEIGGTLFRSTGVVPTRRPLDSMVCNGFMVMGDSACQAMPVFSRGIGGALIGANCAAEAASFALEVQDVSIDALWSYNYLFMKEIGARLAALDTLKAFVGNLSDSHLEKAFKKGLIDKSFASAMLSGNFEARSFFKLANCIIKNIADAAFSLKFDAAMRRAEGVYKHYIDYPKEYDPLTFKEWSHTAQYIFKSL